MRKTNVLSLTRWLWRSSLLPLVVAASCAQGSSDTTGDAGTGSGDNGDSGVADVGTSNPGDDSGGGSNPGGDSGAPGTQDSSAGEDTGSGGGEDASPDTSTPVIDSGVNSGGGGNDSGSVVPTTCADAYGKTGCCVGTELYYCNSSAVTPKPCTGGKVCGWSTMYLDYECVTPPGGPDPSGANPMACK